MVSEKARGRWATGVFTHTHTHARALLTLSDLSVYGFDLFPGISHRKQTTTRTAVCQIHHSEAWRCWWFPFFPSLPALCRFLLHCLCISISTRLLFSAFHSLAPSLHGRVVINPYFIAGEFLSLCRADSSPRSKTRLGPNPILPPSISPSLPPSGPDYRDSGGVVGWGRCWRKGSHHYTLEEGRRNGRTHSMLTWRTEKEEEN